MSLEDLHYAQALSDLCSGYKAFEPPSATTVSRGAAQCLVVKQPGAASGPWDPDETPYMVEPMDMLSSRLHESEVFIGPARTGKTQGLLIGWMGHSICNDPGDMLFIQMTQDKAREFSKTDVRRAIDHSPKVTEMLSRSASDRNTHDIMFRNGMWVRIAWPTVSNVSGSTYRYTAITDYDRIPNADNVDGEGSLFTLALKRTTTFMSRGMSLAESSPGKPVEDANWKPVTAHEAPPVGGILGLYNLTDRRRWYWPCPHCTDWFEAAPGLKLFNLPSDDALLTDIRTMDIGAMARKYGARIHCSCCGAEIPSKLKRQLNARGRWVPEGCTLTPDGELVGTPPAAKGLGYWLGGVAATYQTWTSLIERYLKGLLDYALTGSEETLKTTVNTDQGMPYTPRHLIENAAGRKTPQERAEGELLRYVAPEATRCIVVSVDVQGGSNARFVVQVQAVGPHREKWLVDRHEIRHSKREGMGAEFAPIDPASHPEDWDVLTEKLLLATWRTPIEGREMKARLVVVDTGGEGNKDTGSVATNAYAWYRRLRELKLAGRVMLYKGASTKMVEVIKESKVGKRNSRAKPDIPLYLCDPNKLSDIVDAGLRREEPGPGYIHLPKPKHPTQNPDGWLPQAFFDELGAEVRGKDGKWSQIRKRNESFDLLRMCEAGCLKLGLDRIPDWDNPPRWLAPLEQNEDVISVDDRRAMKANAPVETMISEAPVRRAAPRRRRASVASPYLR